MGASRTPPESGYFNRLLSGFETPVFVLSVRFADAVRGVRPTATGFRRRRWSTWFGAVFRGGYCARFLDDGRRYNLDSGGGGERVSGSGSFPGNFEEKIVATEEFVWGVEASEEYVWRGNDERFGHSGLNLRMLRRSEHFRPPQL